MGRRKGGNKGGAAPSSGQSNSSGTGSAPEVPAKMSVTDPEGVDEVLEERTESSNLDDPAEPLIGSDKTSADYYFDSYSHFGTMLAA